MSFPTQAASSLQASHVTKRYGSVTALDDVSIDVASGECLALVGESGSGKTTLLRCFNRMVTPDAGTVSVGDDDVQAIDPIALRRRVGYVQQEGGLLPHWRIERNVALVPWLHGDATARQRARETLSLVGLDPERFADRWPRQLSGGQRQRVAIARALAARPRVVLLDEPFGALDAITRAELQTTFRGVRRELGITALLVTHDLREAFRLADHVAVMRAGRIEQLAAPRELQQHPATSYVRELVALAEVA